MQSAKYTYSIVQVLYKLFILNRFSLISMKYYIIQSIRKEKEQTIMFIIEWVSYFLYPKFFSSKLAILCSNA